jgi:hypothetical protein
VKDWKTQFYQPAGQAMPLMPQQGPIFPPVITIFKSRVFFHTKNTEYELQSCNTRNIALRNRLKKIFCLLNSYILESKRATQCRFKAAPRARHKCPGLGVVAEDSTQVQVR